MSVTPLYTGNTHTLLTLTWKDDSGNAIDLTAATITVRIQVPPSAAFAGTGTVTITNATAGQFTYRPSVADLATAGGALFQFDATYADSTVLRSDVLSIQILAAI